MQFNSQACICLTLGHNLNHTATVLICGRVKKWKPPCHTEIFLTVIVLQNTPQKPCNFNFFITLYKSQDKVYFVGQHSQKVDL